MDRARNPIIAALDVPTAENALALARELAPVVGLFKIGSELFTSAGPDVVRRIVDLGGAVFLDLKFHDIPNTVTKAVSAATRLGVRMLTVHAGGGAEMMRAAEAASQEVATEMRAQAPLVLGVTVLTSFNGAALAEVGQPENVGSQVERLASLAVRSGLRGLVCSPLEITMLRATLAEDVQLVTPGIRGPQDSAGDQKRTLSAREAIDAGASWLVIGRPFYAAANPRAAVESILASLH
jgi:orotidine-5'-phosphate decarboxylase